MEQLDLAWEEMARKFSLKNRFVIQWGDGELKVNEPPANPANATTSETMRSFSYINSEESNSETSRPDTPERQTESESLQTENQLLKDKIHELEEELKTLKLNLEQEKKQGESWKIKYNSADQGPPTTTFLNSNNAEDGSALLVSLQQSKKEVSEWKAKYEKLKGFLDLGMELGVMKQ
jgi:predicted RNase H-like nuclease (RuvC/YqgF family)